MYFLFQSKYKEDGKKSLSQSIYSQLPETPNTQFAKTASHLQSEVEAFICFTEIRRLPKLQPKDQNLWGEAISNVQND